MDPSDCKTFYFYSEYVNDNAEAISETFTSQGWFTAMHNFCVTEDVGKVPTTQGPPRCHRHRPKPPKCEEHQARDLGVEDEALMEEIKQFADDCRRKAWIEDHNSGRVTKRDKNMVL